tara:strand:+ start:180 stop:506 length:327 start_codon:yes stop_codon:yes gene_type:complete
MILLAALALILDPPCWSDDSWPCEFIAPVTELAPAELDIAVSFSVSRQGYPYGVHVESEDPALVEAISDAINAWHFAPGHVRDDLDLILHREGGEWIAPWGSVWPIGE